MTNDETYTVDMTIRVYVQASSQQEAESLALRSYEQLSPDGIGQYANLISRQGYWYLCEHGDETDSQVWNPYPKWRTAFSHNNNEKGTEEL